MDTFSSFKLLKSLQDTLKEEGLTQPTEIQSKALPLLLGDQSLVGVSETGSGKTLAFALPILHKLKTLENDGQPVKKNSQPRALVLVPTRDLGEQVAKVFKPFTHTTRLRVRTVLGGTAFDVARRNVSGVFEVLVATPGRLVQLMDRKLVDLSDVQILVFDEADQMLDKSFLSDAQKIAGACAPERQMALFSATVPPTTEQLIEQLFSNAEVIRTSGSHHVVATLTTKNVAVIDGKRFPLLEKILAQPTEGGTIIFTNTREQCDTLAELLKKKDIDALIYRGEMDKNQRRKNLKSFRDKQNDILISTDLASRGLDVKHITRVINYHLPKEMQNYIHRVGRTARAGRPGLVINLVTERDGALMSMLGHIKPVKSL
ncbi:DEAD/DEAH box helicase [bacterium]|nr:DEAD/DEAH box helicase [bacterium]